MALCAPTAGVVELVDTTDLKSVDFTVVPVQVRPPAPLHQSVAIWQRFFVFTAKEKEYEAAKDKKPCR